MFSLPLLLVSVAAVSASWSDSSLKKYVDTLELTVPLVPVIGAEFTGGPHHQRTPFAVSPDGRSAYIAHVEGIASLPNSKMAVHVQKVSLDTFQGDGDVISIDGAQEASGLVAHNDGFALLTHMWREKDDKEEYWLPTVFRYRNGKQIWATPVGGKDHFQMDTNLRANKGSLDGDLAFGDNGTYAAFYRAEYYNGPVAGHGGDTIAYIDDEGSVIEGPLSFQQHCGHNFGIALSSSKDIPFASVCTADDGYLRIASNEKDKEANNGQHPPIDEKRPSEMFAAEAFGGTRGSYSVMARLGAAESYLLAWVTRPAGDDSDENKAKPRYVKVVDFNSKDTLDNAPKDVRQFATDTDCFNTHVAAFNETSALVTWEESTVFNCDSNGCQSNTYTGTRFQMVDSSGNSIGEPLVSKDVFVSGDIAKVGSKLCWPYVNMTWDSNKNASDAYGPSGAWADMWDPNTPIRTLKKVSFACIAAEELS